MENAEGVCSAAAATKWPHARAGIHKTTSFLATLQSHEQTRHSLQQLCEEGGVLVCAPEMFQAGTTASHIVETGG